MKVFCLLALLYSFSAEASYRVYQLKVTRYDSSQRIRAVQIVLSTLDHLQYENYYGGYGSAKVEFLDSWYCPGDTSRRQYCKNPAAPGSPLDRLPAAESGQRSPLPYNRQPVIP